MVFNFRSSTGNLIHYRMIMQLVGLDLVPRMDLIESPSWPGSNPTHGLQNCQVNYRNSQYIVNVIDEDRNTKDEFVIPG